MLGDFHIHMILDGVYYRAAIDAHRRQPDDDLILRRLEHYAAQGCTLLRDGGDRWGVSLRARELAPRFGIDYRSPAFPIHCRGHYGGFLCRGFGTWEEYLALLDEVEALGGDFVKLMISGLIDFSRPNALTEPGLPEEQICAMVAQAHQRGFAVMVHANGDGPVNAALRAGVESIEHGAFLSEETLLRLAQSDTVWVPTLSTIGNLIGSGRFPDDVLRPLLLQQQEKVQFVSQHGGHIAPGSDAGAFCVPHEAGLLSELALLSGVAPDNLQKSTQLLSERFCRKDRSAAQIQNREGR